MRSYIPTTLVLRGTSNGFALALWVLDEDGNGRLVKSLRYTDRGRFRRAIILASEFGAILSTKVLMRTPILQVQP